MNCKPGDLAIVVDSWTDIGLRNLGKIVEVLEPASSGRHYGLLFGQDCDQPGVWFVRLSGGKLAAPRRSDGSLLLSEVAAIHDDNLRPIRDNPGDDETLLWAPVPSDAITV